MNRGYFIFLCLIFLLILLESVFLPGCGEEVLPTTNGIRVSVEPNPVVYDPEKGGWYFTVSIENLGPEKVDLVQANITGVAQVLLISTELPEEVFTPEELTEYFGTSEIEPYGKITWEKGFSYQEIEEAISGYEGIPGVSVNSLIGGIKLRIFVYGITESGVHVDGSTSVITFSPKP